MRIDLLGPLAVSAADRRVRVAGVKQHALLAMLALNAGRVVPADRLIDALWGDAGPKDVANALQHPSQELERVYVATVRGDAERAAAEARRGTFLEDGPVMVKKAEVRSLGGGRWEFEVIITEGRKREVRRLCSALGLDVERLVRVRFGPVALGSLPSGEVRQLTPGERQAIERLAPLRPVHLIDQAYDMGPDGGRAAPPSADETRRFLDVARRGGATGASFWVWQHMNAEEWDAGTVAAFEGVAGPFPHRVLEHAGREVGDLEEAELLALVEVRRSGESEHHQGRSAGPTDRPLRIDRRLGPVAAQPTVRVDVRGQGEAGRVAWHVVAGQHPCQTAADLAVVFDGPADDGAELVPVPR